MPEPAAVTVAYVHPAEVSHSFHLSLVEMIGWDLGHHGRLLAGGWIAMRCGTDGLPAARNQTVRQFLAEDRADWLLWIDTDMGFAPDTLDRLLAAADPKERPIVGALCFAQRERAGDGMGGYRCSAAPTIYDWVNRGEEVGFLGRATYPAGGALTRCAGTGSACILIHRSAFERIAKEHGESWYTRAPNPTTAQLISEDLSFCLRAGSVGLPVFVHTGVRTTHFKEFWLSEADYWERAIAPPATEKVAVVVPVLGRPEHAEPFMTSLRASTGLTNTYAIVNAEDEDAAAAWKAAGAEVLRGDAERVAGQPFQPAETFAEKVNLAYRQTREPWLFLVGSDVIFHAGWLDHALALAKDDKHVIGTNDLGNPRVTSGEHAAHLLVRRSYVEETGASWDGPGSVAHEGYAHWFVDDEIVTAAKQRGVWAMALGSRVEHLHPAWGKGSDDDVYQRGAARAEEDHRVFRRRRKAHR